MKDNETFEFEDRTYVNPDISRDEQTAFIDTLRSLQDEKNAQIATETHNLGTDVEPHLGGLSGSEDYWKAKYQTPQTEYAIANLKAAAQQSALNTAMTDYNNMLQNRYQQAYRDYNRRLYEHNRERERKADEYYKNTGNGTTGGGETKGSVTEEYNDPINVKYGLDGLDAIQESMVRTETERIKREEGLNDAQARAKALVNLNLATNNGSSASTNSSSSNGFLKDTADRIKDLVDSAKKEKLKNNVLPSWDSYGLNKK